MVFKLDKNRMEMCTLYHKKKSFRQSVYVFYHHTLPCRSDIDALQDLPQHVVGVIRSESCACRVCCHGSHVPAGLRMFRDLDKTISSFCYIGKLDY